LNNLKWKFIKTIICNNLDDAITFPYKTVLIINFPFSISRKFLGVINWVQRKSLLTPMKLGIYECEPEKPGEGVQMSGYLW